ncbi:hypothetical protein GCM10023333_13510 [Ferrimonas pelagia]|uniref:Uncharacterized protein n=2 Tax=Ferrimonas pelagia TaxID=1177826 RepID=A0ABP9EJN8_9GAMM
MLHRETAISLYYNFHDSKTLKDNPHKNNSPAISLVHLEVHDWGDAFMMVDLDNPIPSLGRQNKYHPDFPEWTQLRIASSVSYNLTGNDKGGVGWNFDVNYMLVTEAYAMDHNLIPAISRDFKTENWFVRTGFGPLFANFQMDSLEPGNLGNTDTHFGGSHFYITGNTVLDLAGYKMPFSIAATHRYTSDSRIEVMPLEERQLYGYTSEIKFPLGEHFDARIRHMWGKGDFGFSQVGGGGHYLMVGFDYRL